MTVTETKEPAKRGHLILSDRAFTRIAAQCAAEIPSVGGKSGGFLGIGRQENFDSRPKVTVELTGGIASLSVEVGLRYPTPVTEVTESLRSQLRTRVSELTGVEVRQIDIRVGYLQARDAGSERTLL